MSVGPWVRTSSPGLVTFEPLGRGGHLGGGTLDLGIQVSVGRRREVGPGYGLVLLRLDKLALRLLELRLQLNALGLDTAALERTEFGLRALDLRLRLVDGCLRLSLLRRTATALQQIQLALCRVDDRVRRLHGAVRRSFGGAACVTVPRRGRQVDTRRRCVLFQRCLVRLSLSPLGLSLRKCRFGLSDRCLRRVHVLLKRRLCGLQLRGCLRS